MCADMFARIKIKFVSPKPIEKYNFEWNILWWFLSWAMRAYFLNEENKVTRKGIYRKHIRKTTKIVLWTKHRSLKLFTHFYAFFTFGLRVKHSYKLKWKKYKIYFVSMDSSTLLLSIVCFTSCFLFLCPYFLKASK